MLGHRTQVRLKRNDDTWALVDVIASCKVGGYVFLIHPSVDYPGSRFSATYAPIGIGVCDYYSVADVITLLDSKGYSIASAIERQLNILAETCTPLLAPETGIQSNDWQYREQYRFETGEYVPVPKVLACDYPKAHYVHLSVTKTESDFVAYTPSDAYGECDRQVRLKFGKYLRKTYPDMSDQEVQAAVVALRAKLALANSPAVLQFATDRPTINEIFETCMYACDSNYVSCMHDKFTSWEHRPYHVYADSPDVAVAYVVERGAIVSRSVVSTKKKHWIRAYSIQPNDSTYCRVLTDLLERNGYTAGDLTGNRLTKLPSRKGGPILPYIDHGGMGVEDAGEYWEVAHEDAGEYVADQTDGSASHATRRCSECERPEDDCECIFCDCCEERFRDGCDTCCMCEQCEGCIEHDACQCTRCTHCNHIVNPTSRHTTACDCDRCSECGELESDCDCDKCTECNELTENCECESEVPA